ncbi:hypothetical protein L7F22_031862 [Adiantum nelumboides]|nr:hypothetical protein [Adiantum nelumboides]
MITLTFGKVSDCIKDSVFRLVTVFAIVLAGFGLRQVFASKVCDSVRHRLPDMATRTSEFEPFVTRFDGIRQHKRQHRLDAKVLTTLEVDVVYEVIHDGEVVLAQWMLDTDALFHVSPRRKYFCSYSRGLLGHVHLTDGSIHEIVGVGDVRMSLPSGALLVLRHVCHVPSLTRSLISVSQLRDNGCHVVLDENDFSLHRGQLVLARGASVDSTCPMQVSHVRDGTISVTLVQPCRQQRRISFASRLHDDLPLCQQSSKTIVCAPSEVRQLEQEAGSCETQLVVQGLCPSVDFSVARRESSNLEMMTCVDDRHDNALRSFTDMPLPMSDSLSHGTSCVDVIAKETDACEPCMAMLIDTESVDELDFREPKTDVLFFDASDIFDNENVLQTSLYDHCESAMIADSTLVLDVLSRDLLSVGVMSTGLAHEGIAHGGEQEVGTLLYVWLDATSGSDAWIVLGPGASLIEHQSSTCLSLLRRLSKFDRHLEPVGIG